MIASQSLLLFFAFFAVKLLWNADAITVRSVRRGISGERFEFNYSYLRRGYLIRIRAEARQCSAQQVICVFIRLLARTTGRSPRKLKPNSVDVIRREAEFAVLQLARFEELIHENALIAFGVPKPRDEAGHPSLLFNRDLDELSVTQK